MLLFFFLFVSYLYVGCYGAAYSLSCHDCLFWALAIGEIALIKRC